MNSENKICPMKFGGQNKFAPDLFCEEERCAWWCKCNQSCALPTLADILADSTISLSFFGGAEAQQGEVHGEVKQ